MSGETLAILVGGGPAPGLNGVIASATVDAIRNGLHVIGLYDGYRHIARGDTSHVEELTLERVAGIDVTGGSILRTSRTNPAQDEATLNHCVESLTRLNVRYLICVGGDDTTYGAIRIAEAAQGRIRVAAVPKTIDNDLPLPDNAPTFGFQTARAVGATIVEALLEDARTTSRWYLCVSMGRTSGALAMGMCAAAGATVAVIPEELRGDGRLQQVADTVAGAIVKRRMHGHDDGVAVVAEGVAEGLTPAELAAVPNVPRDTYGQVRLADIPIGTLLRSTIKARLAEIGVETEIVAKDVGYELRCAKPVPFDVEYTRTLGYGAVQYLLAGNSGALIALRGGHIVPLALDELRDPATGRVRVRRVDVTAEGYAAARASMTRLEADDFAEPHLSQLAACTKLSPPEFAQTFARVRDNVTELGR